MNIDRPFGDGFYQPFMVILGMVALGLPQPLETIYWFGIPPGAAGLFSLTQV